MLLRRAVVGVLRTDFNSQFSVFAGSYIYLLSGWLYSRLKPLLEVPPKW
jgi:hypothetical protein